MIRIFAILYIGAVIGFGGFYMVRWLRTQDKWFWKGVGRGVLLSIGYIAFLIAVMIVSTGYPQ